MIDISGQAYKGANEHSKCLTWNALKYGNT